MPLPYSYRKKTELTEDTLSGRFPNVLVKNYEALGDEILQAEPNYLLVETQNSLFGQKYEFDIHYLNNNNAADIIYELKLEPLLRMSIMVAFGSALFLFLSVSEFLIYGGILTAAFYLINLFFLNAYVSRPIERMVNDGDYDGSESKMLGKQQEEWEKDPYKCPACGADITDLDLYCPDCGIRVKNSEHEIPVSFSKYGNMIFRYQYKEKKKKSQQSND